MMRMWSEIMEQPLTLERCGEKNREVLAAVAAEVRKRRVDRVVIAARGTSDHAAVYGKYAIEMLTGVPVSLAASSVFTLYGKNLNLKNALVIGVSQSGRAADALEVLRGANACGAMTVGITNFADSPIATESRYHLHCEAGKETSVAATKTFTAQLYLLARLAALWSGDTKLGTELDEVPFGVAETLKQAPEIEEKVARYLFIHECFVLARGVNYAVALESALKIQETTYVRAKAFANSDFQHGPIAMLERDIPVIAYAPDGPSLADMRAMIGKLRERELETVVVSNVPSVRELGACGFSIPQTDNDLISPFYNAAVAQMFACKLSLAKGLNPDSPRGLNKVTITK